MNNAKRFKTKFSLAYGMTEKKYLQLQKLGHDAQTNPACDIDTLAQFTGLFIKHAFDLSRSGEKDSARNWLRYFQNARITEVVASYDRSKGSAIGSALRQLNTACHPEETASWETDIQEIRDALRQILTQLTNENKCLQEMPSSNAVLVGGLETYPKNRKHCSRKNLPAKRTKFSQWRVFPLNLTRPTK